VSPTRDPGWRPAIDRPVALLRALAALGSRRLRPTGGEPPVLGIRAVIVVSVGLVAALVVVLALWLPLWEPDPVPPVATAALLLAAVCPVGSLLARRRRLPCADPTIMVERYATTVLAGGAAAEAAALLGLLAAVLAGELWPYLAGVGLYAVGIALAAPTALDVARRADRLAAAGCPHSLREALFGPSTG
jgi:type IV secretory pathway TrbD component